MAVFIECETDPFDQEMIEQKSQLAAGMVDDLAIRRPLRGLQVKENTYSYIRVVDRFGNSFPLEDSSAVANMPMSFAYANYLITQMSTTRAERYQIIPTFSETYLFFFGEQPIQVSIAGSLIESADFTWPAEFWRNYDEYLRGTRLADRQARMYLYVDGILIEGVCVGFNNAKTSDQPHLVPFNMQVLVTNVTYLTDTAFMFPIRSQQIQFLEGSTQPELALDEASSDRSATSEAAQTSFAMRALQLNKAAYAQQRARRKMEQRGALFVAAEKEPGSPLLYQGESGFDAMQRLDPQSSTTNRPPLPVRSMIQDNMDEYLVRPARSTVFVYPQQPTTETGVAAAPAHEVSDLAPEHHVWDAQLGVWRYVPPADHTPDFTDTYNTEPEEEDFQTVDPSVGQMVGYSDPAAEPAFGSGMQTGSLA